MSHRAGAAVALAAVFTISACSGPATVGPSLAGAPAATPGPSRPSVAPTPIPWSARAVIRIAVGGRTLRVVAADDETSWESGLQAVTDLGALDGMLFRFHATTTRAFWMKDTLLPLDVAFFDASGLFVSVATMSLCRADPCPTYVAVAPYATALEARAGSLGFLRPGDRLVMEPGASG